MVRSQTQPCKEHQLCFKLAVSCISYLQKNAHVKKHSYLSCKNHNCDSVLIHDTKKEKEELVLGCVKRGKKYYIHSLYTLLYNLVLHTVLSIIYLECESLFRRIHQTYICLTHLAAFLFGF